VRAYEAEVRRSIANSAETETLIRAYRDGKQPAPKVGEPLPAGVTLPKFLVVAAKRDNRAVYHHVRLDEAALDRFVDQVKPVLALNCLERQYDMAPNLTSQPITKFYFRNGEREVATMVYGLMAPGTRLLAYTELPSGLEPVMPPKELLQLHSRLCQLDYPESQVWTPDYVKVLAWEYSYAPEPSIHWPQKWPSLTSDRTIKRGDVYSIFLDGSTLPELRLFLATRSEKGAIEIDGKKMYAEYRFTFAVYTIARFPRTTDQVLEEMARRERAEERPRPQHKRVWAEMTRILEGEPVSGREWLFCSLALECQQRDPQRKKTLICLLDGERSLWDMQRFWFGRAIGILDIFHVSERIWEVAHCFHQRESEAARQFATHHLRMILDGKVSYVLRNLRRLWEEKQELGSEKRKTVREAITYFENNQEHMRYHEYLAAGYPIGSGVAEGACRHLVKDRLELTGMRWERQGAQSMLHLRAIYLNGEWDQFVKYRIEQEQAALYGPSTPYEKVGGYAQAI
jgi:hypothetical protein